MHHSLYILKVSDLLYIMVILLTHFFFFGGGGGVLMSCDFVTCARHYIPRLGNPCSNSPSWKNVKIVHIKRLVQKRRDPAVDTMQLWLHCIKLLVDIENREPEDTSSVASSKSAKITHRQKKVFVISLTHYGLTHLGHHWFNWGLFNCLFGTKP